MHLILKKRGEKRKKGKMHFLASWLSSFFGGSVRSLSSIRQKHPIFLEKSLIIFKNKFNPKKAASLEKRKNFQAMILTGSMHHAPCILQTAFKQRLCPGKQYFYHKNGPHGPACKLYFFLKKRRKISAIIILEGWHGSETLS